tara:strand:- start:59 stop:919 length:861 start_codon:yes stop_codon:yes gene_type:complete
MRRGKLNKLSYLMIIISALFTVLSYVSDQLVIRYENNLRMKNFDYQNLDTKIKSLESTISSLSDLSIQGDNLVTNELKQRNFSIKTLFIMEGDSDRYKKIRDKFGVFIEEEFPVSNVKWRTLMSTSSLINNIIDIRDSYYLIFNETIFNEINFFSSEIFYKNLTGNDLFENYEDKFFVIKNFKDIKSLLSSDTYYDLKLEYWWDLRNFRLLMVERLYNEIKKLDTVEEYIEENIENKILDLDIMFYEKKKINTYKNYFILAGIISQILTLFFLLLLFRSLIKQKIL